jgi:pimeloyl-ACP methyl ester carboxylesterase
LALFGVEGPDDTLKRPSQVDAVLAEIDRHHPGLLARVRLAREGLRRQPWTKVLPNGASVTVGPWDLQRRIADALDTLPEIQALPTALEAMAAGDYSDLVAWAIPFRAPAPINVMHVSMDCASYASPERLEAIRREAAAALLGDAINAPMPGICTTPGLPRLTDEFRAPLRTDIRTLLVAGTFDGRTPPANLDALRGGFSRADVLVLPGASHSLFREPAALSAALRFLGELGID